MTNRTATTEGKMTDLIEKYFGTEDVSAFESEDEIREYFSRDNLVHMFGADQYTKWEAEEALKEALNAYRQINER